VPCVASPCRSTRNVSSQCVRQERQPASSLREQVCSAHAAHDPIVPRDPKLPAPPILPGFTLGYRVRRRQIGDGLPVERSKYRTDPLGPNQPCATTTGAAPRSWAFRCVPRLLRISVSARYRSRRIQPVSRSVNSLESRRSTSPSPSKSRTVNDRAVRRGPRGCLVRSLGAPGTPAVRMARMQCHVTRRLSCHDRARWVW
jgi:hypothetical protein